MLVDRVGQRVNVKCTDDCGSISTGFCCKMHSSNSAVKLQNTKDVCLIAVPCHASTWSSQETEISLHGRCMETSNSTASPLTLYRLSPGVPVASENIRESKEREIFENCFQSMTF
eukprot:scpid45474/ scgid32220/ 